MKKNTYKIYSLGCKVNQYDSRDFGRKMTGAGFVLSSSNAQMAIINTCAVTKTAISKCKRMLNKARKENPRAKLILMGCWPKAYQEEANSMQVDLVWGVGRHGLLVEQIIKKIKFKKCLSKSEIRNQKSEINKARYFLKIQDGCEQFCSYCIVPYTRGKLWSKPMKEVLNEAQQAINTGYNEIVLSGIHLGLYGRENKQGRTAPKLVDLLDQLLLVKGLGRIRLSSIEINEVTNELINFIATKKKICNHLHLPLQSGSNKILKLMNRPYNIKYFENKILEIRHLISQVAITTDVIVGFPGERIDDFMKTYKFAYKMDFSRIHVFPFSEHELTAATIIPGKIDKQEKLDRALKLRKLADKLERQFKQKHISQVHEVVLEQKAGNNLKGKSELYFDIDFKDTNILGKESKVKIGEIVMIKA